MYQSKHIGGNRFGYWNGAPANESDRDAWAHIGEGYLVGVDAIDDQHRNLALLLNELNKAVKGGGDDASLGRLFAALYEATKQHFAAEHDLMERFNYPDQASHDKAHASLLADALHFKTRLNRGGDLFVLQSIKDWLLNHILTEDRPLGEFLRQKPGSQDDVS